MLGCNSVACEVRLIDRSIGRKFVLNICNLSYEFHEIFGFGCFFFFKFHLCKIENLIPMTYSKHIFQNIVFEFYVAYSGL